MDVEQGIAWLVERLGPRTITPESKLKSRGSVTNLEIIEHTCELERQILGVDTLYCSRESLAALRDLRCRRKAMQLERVYEIHDIRGQSVLATLANMLFNIEMMLTYRLSVEDWNEQVTEGLERPFAELVETKKRNRLVLEPERFHLRMPMSQALANLEQLVQCSSSSSGSSFTLGEFELGGGGPVQPGGHIFQLEFV